MQTILTTSPEQAAEFIRRGRLVAFPTETVYGLGADALNADAITEIFAAKQRPADNPLIAHVGSIDQITIVASAIPVAAQALIDAFFPGPLTIVLPKSSLVPLIATAGLDTIGVRMPGHSLANKFLISCGRPGVAPSANISGRPSPTTWKAVAEDLDGRIDCILQGDETEIGLESTVVDCTTNVSTLLRKGAITLERLSEIVQIKIGEAIDGDRARSPGLKHKHYSPRAEVVPVDRIDGHSLSEGDAFIGISEPAGTGGFRCVCASVDAYAHSLFEFFRECDRRGIRRIYCETVPEAGIGAALMDRVRRAAEA